MVNLREALVGQVRNAFCQLSEIADIGLQTAGDVFGVAGIKEVGDRFSSGANLFRTAQNLFCDRPPEDVSALVAAELSGGQCDGVLYAWTILDPDGNVLRQSGPPNTSPGPGLGPLTLVNSPPQFFPGGVVAEAVIRDREGNSLGGAAFGPVQQSYRPLTAVATPQDGSPDQCGNPPGNAPVYNPNDWTTNGPITYDDDNGNQVTISPTLTFSPSIQIGPGEINVPFLFNFAPDLDIRGTVNLSTGDININFGDGPGGLGGNDPLEQEDPEIEPSGLILIGARVITDVNLSGAGLTEIFQDPVGTNILAPNAGHVHFRYPTSGDAAGGWGADQPIKHRDQIFWAERPASDVEATGNINCFPLVFKIWSRTWLPQEPG